MMRQVRYLSLLLMSLCACSLQTATGVVSYEGEVVAKPTSGGAATGTTMVLASFTAIESNALMAVVDSALNQAYTATQYVSANTPTTSDINVTAPCSKYFNGEGTAVVTGKFNAATASGGLGAFSLMLDFNQCAVVASDGNTYRITGSDVTLEGTESSSVDTASGNITDTYHVTDMHGNITVTDATGYAVPCPVQLTSTLTYTWGDSVTMNSAYQGWVCKLAQQGSASMTLPLTVP